MDNERKFDPAILLEQLTANLVVKFFSLRKRIMTVSNEIKSRLIFVPAAAVIRKGQALSVMTGRKEFADGKVSYLSNFKIKLYF